MKIPFAIAFAVATILVVGRRSPSGRSYIQNLILNFRLYAPAPEESCDQVATAFPGTED